MKDEFTSVAEGLGAEQSSLLGDLAQSLQASTSLSKAFTAEAQKQGLQQLNAPEMGASKAPEKAPEADMEGAGGGGRKRPKRKTPKGRRTAGANYNKSNRHRGGSGNSHVDKVRKAQGREKSCKPRNANRVRYEP